MTRTYRCTTGFCLFTGGVWGGGQGVPSSGNKSANPPSDTGICFWTRACPPPPWDLSSKIKKNQCIFVAIFTTFKLNTTPKGQGQFWLQQNLFLSPPFDLVPLWDRKTSSKCCLYEKPWEQTLYQNFLLQSYMCCLFFFFFCFFFFFHFALIGVGVGLDKMYVSLSF